MRSADGGWVPKLTKIVATIGPTSEQLPVLQEVVKSGMRIMRLNFSHATVEEVELRTKNLRLCQVNKQKDMRTNERTTD
jgi:pyruvate kinase